MKRTDREEDRGQRLKKIGQTDRQSVTPTHPFENIKEIETDNV